MSYERIRKLLKLGAENTEEGRTAAHLAAKLIEKHQLLDAEESPLFPASMAKFQRPGQRVDNAAPKLIAVPATLAGKPSAASNVGIRAPVSAFAVERAKESARLQEEWAEADRVAHSFASRMAKYL